MWLINCRIRTLEEFTDSRGLRYAILSHTWEDGEEVQFDEFQKRGAATKRCWRKIEKTCGLALDDGYEYAWCDMCCIDKTSSAELSEAINSMFRWYAESGICYAHLADYNISCSSAEVASSRWFTRGWTLQELVAPVQIRFYDKSWNFIGTKATLSQQLSIITGIEEAILLVPERQSMEELLSQVPIARRMSWAAKRQTTRVEDIAYCLLGIFGVNLPLLYGEGDRAFVRLQEEIAKNYNDLSMLAWLLPGDETFRHMNSYSGVFAPHPKVFHSSAELDLTKNGIFMPDFTMTNKGIKIETELEYCERQALHVLDINCHQTKPPGEALGIFLKHQGASVFARARPHVFALGPDRKSNAIETRSLSFSKTLSPSVARSLDGVHRGSFFIPNLKYWFTVDARPEDLWNSGQRNFITTGLKDFVGYLEFSYNGKWQGMRQDNKGVEKHVVVLFGYGYGFEPWSRFVLPDQQSVLRAVKLRNRMMVRQRAVAEGRKRILVGITDPGY
jgi:hypothetical protein